jgi:polyisoprenoid-binding protein YceI
MRGVVCLITALILGCGSLLAADAPEAKPAPAPANAIAWDVDAVHSSVEFAVAHLVVSKVKGAFTKFQGVFSQDAKDETDVKVWSLEGTVETASVDTRNQDRDKHLKSPDFFDAEKFPSIEFKSGKVEKVGAELYEVHGALTIHGVTKDVVLAAEYGGRAKDPWGGERVGFTAKTKINRTDFGLKWNQALEAGGVLVGEAVEIVIELEAKKA